MAKIGILTRNTANFGVMGSQSYSNKSEMMYSAADYSFAKNLYVAVPHSAYYSCFLMMKWLWTTSMGKTENDLSNLCKLNPRIGSHEVLINEVMKYIQSNSRNKDADVDSRDFNNQIVQLKRNRVKADYSDTEIDYYTASNAKETALNILNILKRNK